jgi:hypothetical protein
MENTTQELLDEVYSNNVLAFMELGQTTGEAAINRWCSEIDF